MTSSDCPGLDGGSSAARQAERSLRALLRGECNEISRELSVMLGAELRTLRNTLAEFMVDEGGLPRVALEQELQRFAQHANSHLEATARLRLRQIRDRLARSLTRTASQTAGAVFAEQPLVIELPAVQLDLEPVFSGGVQEILTVGFTLGAGVGGAVGGAKAATLIGGAKAGSVLGLAAGPVGAVIGGIAAGAAGLILGERTRVLLRRRWGHKLSDKKRQRLHRELKQQLSKLHRKANLLIVAELDRVCAKLEDQLRLSLAGC